MYQEDLALELYIIREPRKLVYRGEKSQMGNTNIRDHGRLLREKAMFPHCVDIGGDNYCRGGAVENPPSGLLRQINFEVHILASIEPHGFKK